MNSLQKDFIDALEALAPEGVTARVKPQFANTGVVYYQNADFTTILGISYDFQDGYATFNLTEITDEERTAIGARGGATKPSDNQMTWLGWYVNYVEGGLKKVHDGVAYLLTTRCAVKPCG